MTTITMREVGGRQIAPADLEEFKDYVRAWLPEGLPRVGEQGSPEESLEDMTARHRVLQRRVWDGGLAGIMYPTEYGGLGLTREHQLAFLDLAEGYETPTAFSVTHGILIPTLLDFGTEEQKSEHIPAALRGDEMWVQLLSEPSGGSDMAGALTRAIRDGETYVVNGSKIWSTYAHVANFGMLLCRTDPDVPKHRGLSMIIVPLINGNGLSINPIRLATGDSDFCQEFFDDLSLPADNLIGRENDGWSVASQLLFHERSMVGNSSLNDSRPGGRGETRRGRQPSRGPGRAPGLQRRRGRPAAGRGSPDHRRADPVRPGPDHRRTGRRRAAGAGGEPAQTDVVPVPLPRARAGHSGRRRRCDRLGRRVRLRDTGGAVAGRPDRHGGGGTNEMQRNVVGERVLGLPREYSPDKDRPFSEVRHNR